MVDDLKVVGQAGLKDKQIMDILTGRWDYASDNWLGKKLFIRILGSPHPAAKVVSIDTSAAEALDGVEAVCTHEDVPNWSDTIRYQGQEVAGVAAVDEATAARALTLIEVDYDVYAFVLDADEAQKSNAPIVGIYPESNVRDPITETIRGNFEDGFAASTQTMNSGDIGWTLYFQHNTIETGHCTAHWTGDHLYVWTCTQNPFGQRSSLASGLNMPLNKVHLISHGTGSGFGDKHSIDWGFPAAVLARKTGKPVVYARSRAGQMVQQTHQFPLKANITIGADASGVIQGIDSQYWGDACISGSNRGGGGNDCIRFTYVCENARYRGTTVVTNKPRTGAWRCVQHPPAAILTEAAIDMAAYEFGENPLDFRLKNIQPPFPDGVDFDSGRPLASNGLADCLKESTAAIGWSSNYHAPGTETMSDGRMHGIGVQGHIDGHGGMSSARSAIINMTRDGKALLSVGISRAGGGSNTAFCHIVAETLGLSYEDVMTGEQGNTDTSSDGGSQGGSKQVITSGSAFMVAAEDVRDQLFTAAEGELGVTPDKMSLGDGNVFETADPTNSMTIAEAVTENSYTIVGTGHSWGEYLDRTGERCEVRGTCATACEVAVDTETGEVEILNIANACDMGRAVFHKGVRSQIMGGTEMILAQAMALEQIHDQTNGICLTQGFLDTKWPTTLDMHHDRHTGIVVEPIDHCGPYGAKGLGEPALSSYGAISSAVYNAIGKWILDGPITPKSVLEALGKA
jgi:xanthine dehydrogenase molybdenum-binding subunit